MEEFAQTLNALYRNKQLPSNINYLFISMHYLSRHVKNFCETSFIQDIFSVMGYWSIYIPRIEVVKITRTIKKQSEFSITKYLECCSRSCYFFILMPSIFIFCFSSPSFHFLSLSFIFLSLFHSHFKLKF